jgi:RHS repeat-associated protein
VGKGKTTYTYDLSGNRTRLSDGNYNTYYSYDVYNRLTRETTNQKGKAERDDKNYYYDYNGNPILISYDDIGYNYNRDKFNITDEVELAGCAEELTYNGFNELVSEFNDHKLGRYYVYRPDGLMLKKYSTIDGTNYYNWQGDNIIAESGIYYTRGLGLIKSSEGLYYLQNGHGDISALVKESGTLSTKYKYNAFGNSTSQGESSDNPFKYCGEYEDYLLGGIYLRARIYNPSTGRFTTEDPVRDGLNWYVYCDNNPVRFYDPTGKATWFIHGTGSDNSTWKSDFLNYYRNKIYPGESIETHGWSGDNLDASRRKEAKDFAINLVKFAKKNPKEPIRLVGHSHGGNFAILVANELLKSNITVDTLVTIATPVREYQLESYDYITNPGEKVPNLKRLKNVKKHIQVYNNEDKIQIAGGKSETFDFLINWIDYEFGDADREFNYATNIKVDVNDLNERGFIDSHSDMHSNIAIWKKYIIPYLR